MWSAVISGLSGLASQWLGNRREKSAAKHEAKIKVIEHTATWEIEQAKAGQNGWKDEFVTLAVWVPYAALFIGSLLQGDGNVADRVQASFTAMSATPEWYQFTFVAVTLAAVGIRAGKELLKK